MRDTKLRHTPPNAMIIVDVQLIVKHLIERMFTLGYYSAIAQAKNTDLRENRRLIEDVSDRKQDIEIFTFTGFNNTQDGTKNIVTTVFSKASRHFLAVFTLSQITFAHVVLKRYRKAIEEQQVIILVFEAE